MDDEQHLTDFQTLSAAWARHLAPLHARTTSFQARPEQTLEIVQSFDTESERHYCPICRSPERVRVSVSANQAQALKAHWRDRQRDIGENARLKRQAVADSSLTRNPANVRRKPVPENLVPLPSCYTFTCLRCNKGKATALAYEGPEGPEVATFPMTRGSGTPNTPESVAYYVDQAQRAVSAGARSAGAAMFRAAIEMMLYEAGFKDRMLGGKLKQLEQAIKANSAPEWALRIKDYLPVLNEIANGAIHPNDGDIKRQEALDRVAVETMETVISGLLWQVYDLQAQEDRHKATLRAVADKYRVQPSPRNSGSDKT